MHEIKIFFNTYRRYLFVDGIGWCCHFCRYFNRDKAFKIWFSCTNMTEESQQVPVYFHLVHGSRHKFQWQQQSSNVHFSLAIYYLHMMYMGGSRRKSKRMCNSEWYIFHSFRHFLWLNIFIERGVIAPPVTLSRSTTAVNCCKLFFKKLEIPFLYCSWMLIILYYIRLEHCFYIRDVFTIFT